METVLDALKAMKKATYREVAARLDIEPVEALNMLREQKEQGLCDFYDGAWSLGTAKEQKPKRIRPKQQSPLVERVLSGMQGQGAMSANQVAEKLGKSPRGEPAIQQEQQEPAPEVSEQAAAPASKSTAEIIQDIPAFASRTDDLIIPSSRFISTEIRRTKAKLSNLQRLQSAVRELRRHKHLLQGLGND